MGNIYSFEHFAEKYDVTKKHYLDELYGALETLWKFYKKIEEHMVNLLVRDKWKEWNDTKKEGDSFIFSDEILANTGDRNIDDLFSIRDNIYNTINAISKQNKIDFERKIRRSENVYSKFTGLCCLIVGETKNAVGLKYDSITMNAPEIICKKENIDKIKSFCNENKIPVITDNGLSYILITEYKCGEEIKDELYNTVANIFSEIKKKRCWTKVYNIKYENKWNYHGKLYSFKHFAEKYDVTKKHYMDELYGALETLGKFYNKIEEHMINLAILNKWEEWKDTMKEGDVFNFSDEMLTNMGNRDIDDLFSIRDNVYNTIGAISKRNKIDF
jgi:type III secretion system FlhB-like substrate exporter